MYFIRCGAHRFSNDISLTHYGGEHPAPEHQLVQS